MLADVYGISRKDFLELGKHQAWVRILNKNSLVKTYPPPVPEVMEILSVMKLEQTQNEKGANFETQGAGNPEVVSFLKEC